MLEFNGLYPSGGPTYIRSERPEIQELAGPKGQTFESGLAPEARSSIATWPERPEVQ